MPEFEKKSTRIGGGGRLPAWEQTNFMVFDPDQPHKSAEQLAAEQGGLTDPAEVEHNCPGCNKSFTWDIFQAHAIPCYRKWWKVAPGWRRHRSFAGATLAIPEPTVITKEDL